jgi:hypothetical protein
MTVELRARGAAQAWIAGLWRGDVCIYSFESGYASDGAAIRSANELLSSKIADKLADMLGNTLDVRALSLATIQPYREVMSVTDVRNDARRVAKAIRKALGNDAKRFCAIRDSFGPDLFGVCEALDKQAGPMRSLGKRNTENAAKSAMRDICWHWRSMLGREPGDAEHDIAALREILIAKEVKAVLDRVGNESLRQYVRYLRASCDTPRLIVDVPSAREVFVAEGQGRDIV